MIDKLYIESLRPKIELDIQPTQNGRYEVSSTSIEGFVSQSNSILEAIEQALAVAEKKSETEESRL